MNSQTPEAQGFIVVSRSKGIARDIFRSYTIVVDDAERAKLKRGETARISIPQVTTRCRPGSTGRKVPLCTLGSYPLGA
jgi:hypothetical protein